MTVRTDLAVESIGNKSCVDIASNSLELITAIIADNSNFMKDNPQAILDIANEIYKENLLDNTNIVDAFDDAVKIASNSLNNVQGNNIQMNLEDIKNAVLLNKKLNSVMSNASDTSSESSTKNSFKL